MEAVFTFDFLLLTLDSLERCSRLLSQIMPPKFVNLLEFLELKIMVASYFEWRVKSKVKSQMSKVKYTEFLSSFLLFTFHFLLLTFYFFTSIAAANCSLQYPLNSSSSASSSSSSSSISLCRILLFTKSRVMIPSFKIMLVKSLQL